MKKYEFTATDSQGNTEHGIISAEDFKDVLRQLIPRGLYPTDVKELSNATAYNYEKIEGFKKFKRRLEGKKPIIDDPIPLLDIPDEKPKKEPKDWIHVVFFILFVIAILAAVSLK